MIMVDVRKSVLWNKNPSILSGYFQGKEGSRLWLCASSSASKGASSHAGMLCNFVGYGYT